METTTTLADRRWVALLMVLALAVAGPIVASTRASAATPSAVSIDSACAGPPAAGFDDTAGTTFETEIDCLAWYEITKGTGDGSQYESLLAVRRWQMATFVHRLAQYADEQLDDFDLPPPSDQGFDDIDDLDQEFQDAINVLAQIDVVEGKDADTFDPFSNIRRDQMASFVNRLQGAIQAALGGDAAGYTSDERFFPDVTDDNVHADNVDGIASEGVVQGKADGRYHPADPVTRGQMAAFITRHLAVNVDDGVLAPKSSDAPTEEPTDDPADGELDDADILDANGNGIIDVGDLVSLQFDTDLGDTVDELPGEVVEITDGDGSVIGLDCGDDNCVLGDEALDGTLVGTDGVLTLVVTDGSISGDVGETSVTADVSALTDLLVDENGDPVVLPDDGSGTLDQLDEADLDADVIDELNTSLGGLLDDLVGGLPGL